jgi:hypothetical protein
VKDPTHAEMFAFLTTQARGEDDLRFDFEEAIYWFASDYHGGQWSNLYAALCQSDYTPSQLSRVASNPFFYDMLVAEYGGD